MFFNRLAEIAGQYLNKGSKVYLEGSLRTRKWQDQGGQDRYTTEIVANELQMLDSKGGGAPQAGGYQNDSYGQSAPQQAPQQQQQQQAPQQQQQRQQQASQQQAPQPTAPSGNFDDFDDDIPF